MFEEQTIKNFNDIHLAQLKKITKKLEKKSKKHRPPKNNDVLDLVGKDGWWQRCIFLWIILASIPMPSHFMAMSFYTPNLDYWCARPEGSNWTVDEWKNTALPEDKHCFRYVNISRSYIIDDNNTLTSSDEVVPCDSWEYDTSLYSSTVLSQFDLVCEKEWLVSLSTTIFNAGIIASNFVIGHLADRFGRRPLIAVSLIIQMCAAVTCAFSTSFTMFIATRFFTAFGLSGCYNTSFVLLTEVLGPKQRSFYGVAVNIGWCIGIVSYAGVAWLLRDWFWIQVAITAPLTFFLFTCWLLPESPRWLISKGRVQEAEKFVRKAAKTNGRDLSNIDARLKEVITKTTEVDGSGTKTHTIIDLFVTPGLIKKTLIIFFMWFSGIFVYYGLSHNANELDDDPFVNFALSSAVEFPAILLAMVAIYSQGRRRPIAVTLGICGLVCVLTFPFPTEFWWFTSMLSIIGKFCITISVAVFYVFTAEIFPTTVRSIGLGSACACSKLASILAPFVGELGHTTHPAVPQVLFGIVGFLSGVLVLLLPETKGIKAPDTLSEAASRRNPKKKTKRNEHEMIKLLNENKDYKDLVDVAIKDLRTDASTTNHPAPTVETKLESGNSQ